MFATFVKEEAHMETDAGEKALRNRICRRKKRALREPDFVYQKTGGRERCPGKKKAFQARDVPRDTRLVKIELDAAQALAEFSRFAHLPAQLCPSDLRWSKRRKRTPRSCLIMESPGADEMSETCTRSSQFPTIELPRTASLSLDVKASPIFDCRAESPSSPLPTVKMSCRALIGAKDLISNLPIKHDVSEAAVQKPVKVEELESENGLKSSAAHQKLRALNFRSPFPLGKEGPLVVQAIAKDEGSQHSSVANLKVKVLPNERPQLAESRPGRDLVIMDKSTPAINDDKEARRLQRIQANRESARQTIRKKQLLCEELRRRSVSLASENDTLRQKRDKLMQELASLKGLNYQLKVQLDFRNSKYVGSQEQPSQLASLQNLQALGVPFSYTGLPSHVYGWPAMLIHDVSGICQDQQLKKESTAESFQKLQCADTLGKAPGISATRLCISSMKDIPSSLPASASQEGQNWNSLACNETGPPCDADSVASDAHQISGKESEPKLATAIQARDSINQNDSQADCGLGEKLHATMLEHIEGCKDVKGSLPITCGSSCTTITRSILMDRQSPISKFPWRMHHVTPKAAAEARKKRKEMICKKRLVKAASKLIALN